MGGLELGVTALRAARLHREDDDDPCVWSWHVFGFFRKNVREASRLPKASYGK
jgi:hypothetical protein